MIQQLGQKNIAVILQVILVNQQHYMEYIVDHIQQTSIVEQVKLQQQK